MDSFTRLTILFCAGLFAFGLIASCADENQTADEPSDDDTADDDDIAYDDDDHEYEIGAEEFFEPPSYPIMNVEVEDGVSYRLMHHRFPQFTGDLWPCAWGEDDRLYTANGDGFGFSKLYKDIVFNIVDGWPPEMTGSSPPGALGNNIAGLWGPDILQYNRKPTGLTCVEGDLYLFFQNLKTGFSDNPFGEASNGSISVSRDKGLTWFYDTSGPMFPDHIFTTGFFLDYGKCNQQAKDEYVYIYGLDYNWRFSNDFDQTKLFLARVSKEAILDRSQWEFFTGSEEEAPLWSFAIEEKVPVLLDETLYRDKRSGISQGSVVFIPQLNRYLFSSRAEYEWIFYEAPKPWGLWTKITIREWSRWTEDYHGGYPAIIPSKFLDEDGLGGWIVSSLSSGWFDGMYYNMGFRRFLLEVGQSSAGSLPPY